MLDSTELQLTRAIAAGDGHAWNTFVQRYGDLVMSAVMSWLEADYQVPRSQYTSIMRLVKGNLPEPADEPDIDREGLALYQYVLESLKPRLMAYEGKSSLGAFLRLQLREIRHQYMTEELGKLMLPPALAALPTLAQDVYRLGTRTASREEIARRLGVPTSQVAEAERLVRQTLQTIGKEWWTLEHWPLSEAEREAIQAGAPCPEGEKVAAYQERRLSADEAQALEAHMAGCAQCRARLEFLNEAGDKGGIAPPVAVPAWANREVVFHDGSGAPDPTMAGSSFTQKALSQPQWLAGVVLGFVAAAVIMVLIIPRTEYAKIVREPGDQLLAQAEVPLAAEQAAALAEARDLLGRGKIDGAIRHLQTVIAARPDNQEARWLLANTYDRLGDQASAARHYQIYMDVHERSQAVEEQRVKQAQARLELLREMP